MSVAVFLFGLLGSHEEQRLLFSLVHLIIG